MSDVTLVFGIGATKAGTSWLYQYLATHPDCHFRRLKELHYFSQIGQDNAGWRADTLERKLTRLYRRAAGADGAARAELLAEIRDIEDWRATFDGRTANDAAYLAYLQNGQGAAKVIGDFTPAYAMLDTAMLKHMASFDLPTRFIYMLRDPLDRLWSNIRMAARRATGRGGDIEAEARSVMERYLAGDHAGVEGRADYAGTISRLSAAVPAKDLFLGFFETLFTSETLARITDFLGISPKEADLETVVHGGVPLAIDPDHKRRALQRLAPQYEFVTRFFDGNVPAKWRAHMAEVA